MISNLRVAFGFVLAAMLAVTTWASLQCALWEIPESVFQHRWFIATLADTYFAFLTFYLWVAYKEVSNAKRVIWLISILLLGNIAMAAYILLQLFKLPKDARMEDLLLRKHSHNS